MPKTDVVVKLTGTDGNAWAVMGKVTQALKRCGRGDLIEQYMEDSVSGDYDHLLQVAMEYVEVE